MEQENHLYAIDTVGVSSQEEESLREYQRLMNASVPEMSDYLEHTTEEIRVKYPDITIYSLCRLIAESIPAKVPGESQQIAINALKSDDEYTRRTGRNAFLLLNMKSLITVVNSYTFDYEDDPEERDEIMQTVIGSLGNVIDKVKPHQQSSYYVNRAAREAVAVYISQRDSISKELVLDPQYRLVKIFTDSIFDEKTIPFTESEMAELTQEVGEKFSIEKKGLLYEYLSVKNSYIDMPDVDSFISTLDDKTNLQKAIGRSLQGLNPRERQVIELRFALGNEKFHTRLEVGKKLKVSKERVKQIEIQAIRKLRHPQLKKILEDFI